LQTTLQNELFVDGLACQNTVAILKPMRDNFDDDWEAPEPDEDDDTAELVKCPSCGEEIYEEAEQCPYCGEYVTHTTAPLSGRPLWFCVLGVVGVAATVLYFLIDL
jgi:formylmethanofuran dehydrogenase subunit E